MIVTRHGEIRTEERLGLNKKSVLKNTVRAFEQGLTQSDTTGSMARYMCAISLKSGIEKTVRIYGHFTYIFAGEILVTVLPLPKEYINYADKLQKRKKQTVA